MKKLESQSLEAIKNNYIFCNGSFYKAESTEDAKRIRADIIKNLKAFLN